MDRDRRLSLTVGAFALVSLAALAFAIVTLSTRSGVWAPRYRLVAYFDNVQGLIAGAPVWLAGRPVGRVESVSFGERPEGGRSALQVVLQIDREVRERIRNDSVATIGTIGLLGDRYVEVSIGTTAGQPLDDGAEIRTITRLDVASVVAKGTQALDGIATLAANLNRVIEGFAKQGGGESLASSVDAIGSIVSQIQEGEGLLHSLIYDEYTGGGVESIERSLMRFENILREIDQGEGILHSLIYDAPTEQDLVIEALEAGARLNSILAKIDRGEGTLGMIVNDPTLYEDLKLLVGGANRSRLVRGMVRSLSEDEK
jgi:phospholipid/cholesterol/gamma-HCH transport system substrate-binding protein